MYAFNIFLLDATIFLAFSSFYVTLAFFNCESRWILYLLSWTVGAFSYPILLKHIFMEKNPSYLRRQCKIIALILLPFTLGFMVFALKTNAFKHNDWESIIFFRQYVLLAMPLIILSFAIGDLVSKYVIGTIAKGTKS